MKLLCSILLTLALTLAQALAAAPAPQGVFTSVNGKVQVRKAGGKARTARKDSTVRAGETIATGAGSDAAVRFFDGSELKVGPDTQFTVSKLQKGSLLDKVLQFKLAFGKLLAGVKKLATARSSFEIEAGGVVCGVRGTHFSMDYDPKAEKVEVKVDDGSVFGRGKDGKTIILNAGQTGIFLHGIGSNASGSGAGKIKFNPDTLAKKGPGGEEPGADPALGDLAQQAGLGLAINGDNTITDPAVGGSVKVNVLAHVGVQETVP